LDFWFENKPSGNPAQNKCFLIRFFQELWSPTSEDSATSPTKRHFGDIALSDIASTSPTKRHFGDIASTSPTKRHLHRDFKSCALPDLEECNS
jgi:hypothetical protein